MLKLVVEQWGETVVETSPQGLKMCITELATNGVDFAQRFATFQVEGSLDEQVVADWHSTNFDAITSASTDIQCLPDWTFGWSVWARV